jgi:hypothetical protein
MFAGKLKHLRRPASSGPDSPKRRFEKAKPSTVAAAVAGSFPSFSATQNGREPQIYYHKKKIKTSKVNKS